MFSADPLSPEEEEDEDDDNNTLIHEEEEHQENNATKKTPSFVEHVESFYEANEENVKKAGFAAAVALILLLVYCVWKRLRSTTTRFRT